MSYARLNNSTRAEIDQSQVFATGTFKNVWKGIYTVGARTGQPCVAKEFKTGSVYESHYFEEEMNVIRLTQVVIDAWHAEQIIDSDIRLNTPEIWKYSGSGVRLLLEPMIENFEKFNSNTGWASNTGGVWSEAMQALSHFSFHNSNGRSLLCDLQGGLYSDGYVLSDPVIMSQGQDCGPADLGPDGIRSFFQRHRCGRFCKSGWTRPRILGQAVHPMRVGTTMINPAHLPTRPNRNPLTRVQEYY
ncbi:kinase-like domain-containing protein [Mycena albidolilacea]|uniref:Kinase-like domain-containing protein n=1 Tax=Mycena albidolilacea TaxID=1033008 RepID=A0AAD7E7N0_9AGAR|nr:kinase-like domain-containing protein [Mycena albidolilacea]